MLLKRNLRMIIDELSLEMENFDNISVGNRHVSADYGKFLQKRGVFYLFLGKKLYK